MAKLEAAEDEFVKGRPAAFQALCSLIPIPSSVAESSTRIDSSVGSQRCLVYIDLNMVRARVVSHPSNWAHRLLGNPESAKAVRNY